MKFVKITDIIIWYQR